MYKTHNNITLTEDQSTRVNIIHILNYGSCSSDFEKRLIKVVICTDTNSRYFSIEFPTGRVHQIISFSQNEKRRSNQIILFVMLFLDIAWSLLAALPRPYAADAAIICLALMCDCELSPTRVGEIYIIESTSPSQNSTTYTCHSIGGAHCNTNRVTGSG